MTAQIHENLILNGERTTMASCPTVPSDHPLIVAATSWDHDDDDSHRILCSTACWRRYRGTWEIKDGRLYLLALKGSYGVATSEPIFADWFTGLLRVPQGELLEYVHLEFGSVYETELFLDIEDGIVVDSWTKDNRGKTHDANEIAWRILHGGE
ncbi:MAG: hypothetical protein ABL921_30320 [Pirellula sp.]